MAGDTSLDWRWGTAERFKYLSLMADMMTVVARSKNMARIRSTDTKPELRVRRFLHAQGFRYRLHAKDLSGRPDLRLSKYGLVIFVHGCFWHRHVRCRYTTFPSTNVGYWRQKFARNVARDRANVSLLLLQGWRVLIIWECGLKSSSPDLSWLPQWIASNRRFSQWPGDGAQVAPS